MKKIFAILLLLPVLSQAQIISGKEFRYVPKTAATYAPYPDDSSIIMINRATGKFFRTHVAGGGGATPAGNNTNIQYKRNGSFTGGDSLLWTSTGLEVVGRYVLRNTGGSELLRIYSDANVNTFMGYRSGATNNFAGGGVDNTGFGSETLFGNTTGNLNAAFGKRAMVLNTTGAGNSAFGAGALGSSTGSNNAGIGYHTLLNNTGDYNTASGSIALQNKTGGAHNTAGGYRSLNGTGTYSYNTGFGSEALIQTTGDGNTGVGFESLYAVTTGTYNTALGYGSGLGITGSRNVIIGADVGGYASSRSNRLMIDNSNTNNPLIDGDFNADTLRINGKLYVSTVDSKVPADTVNYAPAWVHKTTGELSKATFHYQGAGGANPAGSNQQLQYNNAGAFAGTSMTYNNSTNVYTLSSGSLYPLILKDNTATGVGGHIYGSSVLFSANRSVGGETTTAYITGALNDTSNAAYKSYLAFATTQVSDGTAERMRLTHDGNLLVGTTSNSGYRLDVIGPSKLTGALTHNTTNASDAAYATTTADYYIFLPDITANRVITLPSAASSTGRVIKIWNKNSAAFTWSFSTAVKDASSADVTNLTNDTWYHIISDGTNWVIEN